MLPIFIRDCTPALNSLMKTPSAVCIREPRCHEDELGSPCSSTGEGSDAGVHVSPGVTVGVTVGVAGSSQQGRY